MEDDKKENKENKDAEKREKEKIVIDGTMCIWIGDGHSKYVLMQPMEKEAFETLAAEASLIKKEVSVPFCIIGIAVESWNRDLSPWAAYQSERFCGIAAVSPSVWSPTWMTYVKTHIPHVKKAYFSRGDREEKTKNCTMAVVGENIRTMQEVMQLFILKQNRILEWNKGNHFQNTIERTARGFVWLLKEFEKNDIPENRNRNRAKIKNRTEYR